VEVREVGLRPLEPVSVFPQGPQQPEEGHRYLQVRSGVVPQADSRAYPEIMLLK
jgi:hypothetical protein